MLGHLPAELVCTILRTTAEVFLVSDRTMVLNLARSSTLAYMIVTPVLYRTLTVDNSNRDIIVQMFDETLTLSSGFFALPAERLWRHVRRLFIEPAVDLPDALLRHFVNLEAIYMFAPFTTMQFDHLSTPYRLRRIYTLASLTSPFAPPHTTHVSFYVSPYGQSLLQDIQTHVQDVLPESVTHFAIEFSGSLPRDREQPLSDLLQTTLARPGIKQVAFRIYGGAIKSARTVDMVRRAALATHDPSHRVRLWLDRRPIEGINDDVAASREDAVIGRTPWGEAETLGAIEDVNL